jgi:hypothetical protein
MEVEEFKTKFKEGDVLVSRVWVFIYAGLKESDIFFVNGVPRHAVIYHALGHMDKLCEITTQTRTGIGYVEGNDFRLANNKEKKYLIDWLSVKHMRWNPETKSLEYIAPVYTYDDVELPF